MPLNIRGPAEFTPKRGDANRAAVMQAPAGKAGATRKNSITATPVGREATMSTAKFTAGCFTVSSGGGVVQPGQTVKVVVEADPQTVGQLIETLSIDIEQRPYSYHPDGVKYRTVR